MIADLLTLILICAILRIYQIKTGKWQSQPIPIPVKISKKIIAKRVDWK